MNYETGIQHNVTQTWNDDLSIEIDEQGAVTGSQSFQCALDEAIGLLGATKTIPGFPQFRVSSASLKHQGGNIAKVTVKFGGTTDGNDDPNNDEPEKATHQLTVTPTEYPLEAHPKYRDAYEDNKDKYANIIAAAKQGKLDMITIDDTVMFKVKGTALPSVDAYLDKDDPFVEYLNKIMSGITSYLYNDQRFQKTYAVSAIADVGSFTNRIQDAGKITDEGLPDWAKDPGNGREWMFDGLTVAWDGEKYQISENFHLSGPGGWDDDLYPVEK